MANIRISETAHDFINILAINENKSHAEIVDDMVDYIECKKQQSFYEKLNKRPLGRKKIIKGKKLEGFNKNSKEKEAIRALTNKLIKNGTLKKLSYCQSCFKNNVKLQCHHESYSVPDKIKWLCQSCHGKAHSFLLIPRNQRISKNGIQKIGATNV